MEEDMVAYTRAVQPQVFDIDALLTHQQAIDKFRTQRRHDSFRPKLHSKHLLQEPKFLISLDRKKHKVQNSVHQRTASEKPSRSSYRGQKLKSLRGHEEEFIGKMERIAQAAKQAVLFGQVASSLPRSKTKNPHLHFNLHYVLQQKKMHKRVKSKEEVSEKTSEIMGSNRPYMTYFSSCKSYSRDTTRTTSRGRYTAPTTERSDFY